MTLPDLIRAIEALEPAQLSAVLTAAAARLARATPQLQDGRDDHHPEPRLLDAKEMAGRLSMPVTWVREQARLGKLPSIRAGKYVRFNPEAVLRALDHHG